jgi:hypothetical protein
VPLVIVSASGGARMQEGTLSLMQLAKTVAALERMKSAGVPFVSVLSDPTTGGVFASFAVLGDVNVAEPNALIGFAGARVSAGTIAQELPPGFQRSEFLYAHGFLDRVVHRTELRAELSSLLGFLVARPVPVVDDTLAGDVLGLPSFRPLSFLSNLADRMMQTEPEAAPPTDGNGAGPSEATRPGDASSVASPSRQPRAASGKAAPTSPPDATGKTAAGDTATDGAHEPAAADTAPDAAAASALATKPTTEDHSRG